MPVYVVNRATPGQNKGDWAVRTGNKIISNHRKKSAAKKKARTEARKRDTYVRVQKANGRWEETFTPQ